MAKRPKGASVPVTEPLPAQAETPAQERVEPTSDLLDTALLMIGTDGWQSFTLTGLAREMKLPVSDVYARFPARVAVLDAFGRRMDGQMLALQAEELEELNTRERLFELLMRRLDAMKPYKEMLRKVGREGRGDLEVAVVGLGNLGRAVVELVDAAGVRGTTGLLARQAVGILYLRVVRTWMDDDDPELARTLAELDKGLARMERLAQGLCRLMPKQRAAEPEPAAA